MSMSKLTPRRATLQVVRVTIEAASPICSASGENTAEHDNALVRDVNGLPMLMGTSLAGVLRHLHADYFGEGDLAKPDHPTNRLFGWEEDKTEEGTASRIEVDCGFVHDQYNQPVMGILSPQTIKNDLVLNFLSRDYPIVRENVAIDPRGVAAEHAKFDRVMVPTGTRFSFDMSIESDSGEDAQCAQRELKNTLSLLNCPYLRLGQGGRAGLGMIKLASNAVFHSFDRSEPKGWNDFVAWRAGEIPEAKEWRVDEELKLTAKSVRKPVIGTIDLKFEGWWRIGGGIESSRLRTASKQHDPDDVPFSEPYIDYPSKPQPNTASVLGRDRSTLIRFVVPGASIKGALAHRTEFERRKSKRQWVNAIDFNKPNRLTDCLFGSAKDKGKESGWSRARKLCASCTPLSSWAATINAIVSIPTMKSGSTIVSASRNWNTR